MMRRIDCKITCIFGWLLHCYYCRTKYILDVNMMKHRRRQHHHHHVITRVRSYSLVSLKHMYKYCIIPNNNYIRHRNHNNNNSAWWWWQQSTENE